MTTYKHLSLTVLLLLNHAAMADETTANKTMVQIPKTQIPNSNAMPTVQLAHETIVVDGDDFQSPLLNNQSVTNIFIKQEALQQRATTLGDALAGELGVHSNHFGGGASAPIIRGQEGKRLKILQNGSEVVDMSGLSPDHAIAVDTTLAKQVEIVRGSGALLYASGNSAGVVNVVDDKIPSKLPSKLQGDVAVRLSSANREKLITASAEAPLGEHVAVRVAGLSKQAADYKTPRFDRHVFNEESEYDDTQPEFIYKDTLKHLPDSHAKSNSGTLGVSWVGNQGFLGASVSLRRDKYGLPNHSHEYEECSVHGISQSALQYKPYLRLYPFLMENDDLEFDNAGLECHTHDDHAHDHDHEHGKPWIDLKMKRYDVQGQINAPFAGIDKIRASMGKADYHHDEIDGGEKTSFFDNQANVWRLEASHTPIHTPMGKFSGVFGIGYLTSKNSGLVPPRYEDGNKQDTQNILHNNKTKTGSVFWFEEYKPNDKLTVDAAARIEKQTITMDYDKDAIYQSLNLGLATAHEPDIRFKRLLDSGTLNSQKQTARSYAVGTHLQLTPKHKLSLNLSHQERLPNAQELYAHGMHLATNSFEIGNRFLNKEKSNNIDLGLTFQGDKWDYRLGGYHYDFDNYVFLQTLSQYKQGLRGMRHDKDLKTARYEQAAAKFYGFDANIGYQINDVYHVALFGDYIRGKLTNLPDKQGRTDAYGNRPLIKQPDSHTPRLPPKRLGMKLTANVNANWSGSLEYRHTFKQDKLANFERPTPAHNLVNLGLNYQHKPSDKPGSVQVFFNANNLLNDKVFAHETFFPDMPQMGRNFMLGANFKF